MKKFLAFDSASEELIVAGFNGKKYFENRVKASGTENLMPEIDKVLKKLKMDILEVEVLLVGVGPGSWTGARVSVVTALGLVSGNPNLKVQVFNSFDLISYNEEDKAKTIKLVKAYANYVYAKLPSGEILALPKDELSKYYDFIFIGTTKVTENTIVKTINFEKLTKSIVQTEQFVNIDEVEPMYLRLSQAEYQRMEKLKNGK